MQDTNKEKPKVSASRSPQFRVVMAPVDFSESSERALLYAVEFARQNESRLIVLHVVEPPIYAGEEGMGGFAAPPLRESLDAAMTRLAKRKEAVAPDLEVEIVVRSGAPYFEISEAARELRVDLIIISTHGRTGLEHALLGSAAERVVRHAPCPTLVLRQK